MKKILLAGLVMLPMSFWTTAWADSLLSVPGLSEAIAEAAKNSKAVGLVDFNGEVSGGAFLPVRSLHDGQGINYLDIGFGGAIKQEEHAKPLLLVDFDISAIVRRVEGYSKWYGDHVNKKLLPDFWVGPYVSPLAFSTWKNWKQVVGGSISVGF